MPVGVAKHTTIRLLAIVNALTGIEEAERDTRALLAPEIADYSDLTKRVLQLAWDVLSDIQGVIQPPLAASAVALLCVRLVNDLRSVMMLAQDGYVVQALTLDASMCELAHVAGFIGDNEERADHWMEYDSPKPFVAAYDAILATVRAIGLPDSKAREEYENNYKQLCMPKHGNPLIFRSLGIEIVEKKLKMYHGPYFSPKIVRAARVAFSYGVRYLWIGLSVFGKFHTPEAQQEQRHKELSEFASAMWALREQDRQRYGTTNAADAAG
jgi:hypothetical protein